MNVQHVDPTGPTVRLTADRDLCIGAGQCASTAPALFDQRDQDGLVVVLNDHPSASQVDDARQAVALCPAGAIQLLEGFEPGQTSR